MSGDERVRLFVALELPDDVRSELLRWRDSAISSALASVRAESLHATLCFLGSVDVGDVPAIGAACAGALDGGRPVSLALGAVAWLPPRRPRVLAAALADPSAALSRHQAELAAKLAAGGWYRLESRPFLPHVTVARVRRGARVRAGDLAGPEPLTFAASRVTLFRSRLGAGGARYEALRVIELLPGDR